MNTALPTALTLTGERTLPGIEAENYWFRRHEAGYLAVADLVEGPRLLEVGPGEGYGAELLAQRVEQVLALDYDRPAIEHLARRYPALAAVHGNLAALPVASGVVDTLVSLQVVEHVWDHAEYLLECRRVLRPGGLLVLSTPNRLTFSPGMQRFDKPRNPFHTWEFTAEELSDLLARHGFAVTESLGLFAGMRLAALDRHYASGLVHAQLDQASPSWPDGLAADVASVAAADFDVRSGDLDRSLDLIFLARPV